MELIEQAKIERDHRVRKRPFCLRQTTSSGSTGKLRVLLTVSVSLREEQQTRSQIRLSFKKNDDGPPSPGPPYILERYRFLTQTLGKGSLTKNATVTECVLGICFADWDVKVVIPSTQNSWIGVFSILI